MSNGSNKQRNTLLSQTVSKPTTISAPPTELPEQQSYLSLVPSFTSKLNSQSSTAINKAQKCSST